MYFSTCGQSFGLRGWKFKIDLIIELECLSVLGTLAACRVLTAKKHCLSNLKHIGSVFTGLLGLD